MRIGQHVQWKSLAPESKTVFKGTLRCLEHDKNGWAVVEEDGTHLRFVISRSRLIVPKPPASKDARDDGRTPAGSAAVLAEVA
jgi:hypothetical protein